VTGLSDSFQRPINYLRVSVTDRCNLRCVYCMPAEGVRLMPRQDILTYEEIHTIVAAAAEVGINKVRITGGEPLARAGLARLVEMISQVAAVDDISMTTNATLLARHAVELLSAPQVKGGEYTVVLDPILAGVFVHEAFGHLSESDFVYENELMRQIMTLGKEFGCAELNIIDSATVPGLRGSYKYDDEGVPAQKTLLKSDGVVAGLMHNRETARKFNAAPTGNARAEDFRVEPIIRMRNTFMAPRDYSLEELVEGIRAGYYFKSFRGGQANIDGTFQVGIQEAYEIVNGEIG
jgi:predicted Zn-dependent protease